MTGRILLLLLLCLQSTRGAEPFLGMHLGSETDCKTAIPLLRNSGIRTVRLWADIDWRRPMEVSAFQKAREMKAAGFEVIVLFSSHIEPAPPPSYAEVTSYFEGLLKLQGLPEAIDFWEILNEVNLVRNGKGFYWNGTPDQYVNEVLKGAWDTLDPAGESVLGASFTAYQDDGKPSIKVTRDYVKAGYLKYCHYAGSHPYTESLPELQEHLQELQEVFGDKPIIVSEWNFKQRENHTTWAEDLARAATLFRGKVRTVCLYRMLETTREKGWPGFYWADYRPRPPFAEALKAWQQ